MVRDSGDYGVKVAPSSPNPLLTIKPTNVLFLTGLWDSRGNRAKARGGGRHEPINQRPSYGQRDRRRLGGTRTGRSAVTTDRAFINADQVNGKECLDRRSTRARGGSNARGSQVGERDLNAALVRLKYGPARDRPVRLRGRAEAGFVEASCLYRNLIFAISGTKPGQLGARRVRYAPPQ